MSTSINEIDLTPNPRRDIGEKILSVSSSLFDAVKNAPLSLRAGFPRVLRNNNFALTVRVTKKYAFLEVSTKLRAQRSREAERMATYRQLFLPSNSGQPVMMNVDNARLCRVSGVTVDGAHAFGLGNDISLCVSEVRNSIMMNGHRVDSSVDVLYVVGFGDLIRDDEAWREFDTLIRVTLADWSVAR